LSNNAPGQVTGAYIEQLLREGIAAAKVGDKENARKKLREVTELDQYNEKAWYWLASVVESDEERRICLGNVVVINPKNERAKQMLDELISGGTKMRGPETSASPIGRLVGMFLALKPIQKVIVALGALAILSFCMLIVSGGGGASTTNGAGTNPTAAQPVAVTNTAVAQLPPTDGPTSTPVTPTDTPLPQPSPPALPPSWTPQPTFTPRSAIKATPLTAPPADALTGRMIVSVGQPLTLDRNLPLFLLDVRTGELTPITGRDRGDFGLFLPDGSRLMYSRYLGGTGSQQIRVLSVNGTQGRELSEFWFNRPVLANHRMGTLSKSGLVMAFSAINKPDNDASPDIYWMPITFAPPGTPTVTPTYTLFPTETETPVVDPNVTPTATNTPTFTPTNTPQPRGGGGRPSATPLPVIIKRLTGKDSGDNTWPALGPDDSRIIWVSDRSQLGQGTDIYLTTLDGQSADFNLTNDGQALVESAPAWSPDGTRIVFAAAEEGAEKSAIYVMNADGSGRELLVEANALNQRPRWSPDGNYIAFTSDRTEKFEIFVIELATKTVYQLTSQAEPLVLNDWGR
jgi:hypothetical protein